MPDIPSFPPCAAPCASRCRWRISATADDRAVDALIALDHALREEAPGPVSHDVADARDH